MEKKDSSLFDKLMSKKSISGLLVRDLLMFLKECGFGNSCKDKWDGFGGKLEEGETIREAAARFFLLIFLFILAVLIMFRRHVKYLNFFVN
jgi:hypothetical protein